MRTAPTGRNRGFSGWLGSSRLESAGNPGGGGAPSRGNGSGGPARAEAGWGRRPFESLLPWFGLVRGFRIEALPDARAAPPLCSTIRRDFPILDLTLRSCVCVYIYKPLIGFIRQKKVVKDRAVELSKVCRSFGKGLGKGPLQPERPLSGTRM